MRIFSSAGDPSQGMGYMIVMPVIPPLLCVLFLGWIGLDSSSISRFPPYFCLLNVRAISYGSSGNWWLICEENSCNVFSHKYSKLSCVHPSIFNCFHYPLNLSVSRLLSRHVGTRMQHSSSCNRAKWEVIWLLDIPLFACFDYADHSKSQWIDNCHQHKPFLTVAGSLWARPGSLPQGYRATQSPLPEQEIVLGPPAIQATNHHCLSSFLPDPQSFVTLDQEWFNLCCSWQKVTNNTGWGPFVQNATRTHLCLEVILYCLLEVWCLPRFRAPWWVPCASVLSSFFGPGEMLWQKGENCDLCSSPIQPSSCLGQNCACLVQYICSCPLLELQRFQGSASVI